MIVKYILSLLLILVFSINELSAITLSCSEATMQEKTVISKYVDHPNHGLVFFDWNADTKKGSNESVKYSDLGDYTSESLWDISYASDGKLYGVIFNILVEIDPSNGKLIPPFKTIGDGDYMAHPNYELVGDQEGYLYTVDAVLGRQAVVKFLPTSPATTTLVAYVDTLGLVGEGDLAWSGGFLYWTATTSQGSASQLVKIDVISGSVSSIMIKTSSGATFTNADALFNDSKGNLYFATADDIYNLDKSTGVATHSHALTYINGEAGGATTTHAFCAAEVLPPEPFICQSESFVSFNTEPSPTAGDSKYDTISLVDGNLTAAEIVTGVNGVNSIGYNIKDDLIWGYNLETYKVVRIDADKKAILYDVSGLDKRFYVAADVSADGVLYLSSRGNSTERTHIARVKLDTLTSLPEVTLTQEIDAADMAFNPADGKLYFIQTGTDILYDITFSADGLTGTVNPVGSLGLGVTSPIINFFDKDGNFYFNKDTTTMYKVNVASSSIATPFSTLNKALRNGDGARCANAIVSVPNKITGNILDTTTGTSIANATVSLYHDTNSDGQPDAGDTQTATTTTDASGNYSFDVVDGKYFVVVDSTSLHATAWMEQTLAPKGGLCVSGTLASQGACYGGRRGGVSDDFSSLITAEHMVVMDINGTDISGVDFGFSADVVTNVSDDGQGSLRQFITNANAISGENVMKFVPTEVPNSGTWWTISLSSILPNLTDAETTIDGTAYALDGITLRDENSGSVSGGIKLGTGSDGVTDTGDDPMLLAFDKPELEIVFDSSEQFGFKVFAHDIAIKNLAFYGASGLSGDIYDEDNGNIQIAWDEDTNNIVIENNFIGVRADGSVPVSKSSAYGINFYYSNSINFSIKHNYISSVGKGGIYLAGFSVSHGEITQNEVQKIDWFGKRDDGIGIESDVNNVRVFENYVHDNEGPGLESYEGGSDNYWYDNTVYHNGHGAAAIEFFGMRLVGTPGMAYQNRIYDNKDAGILVEGSGTKGQRIFKNAIYQNGTIGIDLDIDDTEGDGVTTNNGMVDATKPNNDMDFPVFTIASLNGTTLHLEGYVGSSSSQSTFADATIEVYKADISGGDTHGEGRWYLGACVSDSDGNFNCDIADINSSLVASGDFITATATDTSNSTSEFGENFEITSSQALGCMQHAWLIKDTKSIFEVDIAEKTEAEFATALSKYTNALGYNEVDGYLWGYNNEDRDKTLISIGKDGSGNYDSQISEAVLGVGGYPDLPIDGADDAYVNVGDVDANGHLYLLYRKNDHLGLTTEEDLVYVVDLNDSSVNYLKVINHFEVRDFGRGDPAVGKGLDIVDWAFHPINGKIYSVSAYGRLYEVDPASGSVVASDSITGLDNSSAYETFFDNNGYLYAYSAGAGKVFRIDLTDPANPVSEAVLFSTFGAGAGGDSARCNKAPISDKSIIEIEDAQVVEGNSGNTDISFTITSDRNISSDLTINYTFTAGTAQAGSDYHDIPSSVTMLAGTKSVTLTLPMIVTDGVQEIDESFLINLNSADALFLDGEATGTIINDDYEISLNVVNERASYHFDGYISTKVVAKPFTLTVMAKSDVNNSALVDVNITKLELLDETDATIGTLYTGLVSTNIDGFVTLSGLSYDKAIKVAKVKITASYKGSTQVDYSQDEFAIRPDRFSITPVTSAKAGEGFALGITAKVYGALAASTNYNETEGSSYALSFVEHNASTSSCITGTTTMANKNFSNGAINETVTYSEVGLVDINISENLGSEFAIVDALDTPDVADRLIEPDHIQVSFTPSKFEIQTPLVTNHTNTDVFTYYAASGDTKERGVNVTAIIEAQNFAGDPTINYSGECYAKDTDLNIVYTGTGDATGKAINWYDVGNAVDNSAVPIALSTAGNFDFPIADANFTAGVSSVSMKFNLGRSVRTPMEPFTFKVTTMTASDSDGISTVAASVINTGIDFYYGRLNTPDMSVVGDEATAKIYNEVYCKNCVKTTYTLAQNSESADSINWYIITGEGNEFLTPSSSHGNIIQSTGVNTIALKAPKLPHRNTISYEPKEWLKHNLFSDVNTQEKFKVTFTSNTPKWAGQGEQGMTVDLDSSKSGLQKMDW